MESNDGNSPTPTHPHPPRSSTTVTAPSSSSHLRPSSPSRRYSRSAILFSSSLVQHLESHSALRLPSTYIGVRRVRPTQLLASKIKRPTDDTHDDGDDWVPTDVLDHMQTTLQLPNCRGAAITSTNANVGSSNGNSSNNGHNNDLNHVSDPNQPVYKVTNPDGTQRRMTTKEKKLLKYERAQAKRSAKKEGRQAKHEQLVREAKAEKRERKRMKKLAWKNKQQGQRQHNDNDEGEGEAQENHNKGLPSAARDSAETQKGEEEQKATRHQSSAGENMTVTASSLLDEELAALRGERKGIPPAMLTPAATAVAQEGGALADQETSLPPPQRIRTTLDPVLSQRWATQLQKSMVPVEASRAKEAMRPMAYQVVPEVWKRLCPDSLWANFSGEGVAAEKGVDTQKNNPVVNGTKDGHPAVAAGTPPLESTLSSEDISQSLTNLVLRDPSPAYDEDAYLIFRHLHRHSRLHLACGALFGCDFLLYDGRREDRHSFAGLRVYGGARAADGTAAPPSPSAYDLAGFVRAMNTARKLALVATVVRGEDGAPARVALVELALEKVLTAQAHVRKGATEKRKTEEEVASGLVKTKKQK